MSPEQLRLRTKAFALRVMKLVASMRRDRTSDVLARQLLRAATSVGANYRSACRARSRADFAAKMAIVEEEADECVYWLELISESGAINPRRLRMLLAEAGELTAIAAASRRTARTTRANA